MDPLDTIKKTFLFVSVIAVLFVVAINISMPILDAKYSTSEKVSGTLVAVQNYQDRDSSCDKPECWKYQIALKQADGEVIFFDATSSQVYQYDLKVGTCVRVDFINHYVRTSNEITDIQPCGE